MLFSGYADRVHPVKERRIVFTAAMAFLTLTLLPFCFISGLNPLVVFAAALVFGAVQTFLMSFRTMLVGSLATSQTAIYILIAAAVCQLASGAMYFAFSRRFISNERH